MELRRDPRFQTEEEVRVTLLDRPEDSLAGKVRDLSARGMGLVLREKLPAGTLIRVEWSDTLLLGEVIYCQRQGEEFIAGIEVDEFVNKDRLAEIQRSAK